MSIAVLPVLKSLFLTVLPLSEEPFVLQDLVADPVHGRYDGGVRVPDVDRRHVGHGRRVHDVGRHDSQFRHSKGGKFKFGQREHCELSQLTEECTQARATDRPTVRDHPRPTRARACALPSSQPRTEAGARRPGDRQHGSGWWAQGKTGTIRRS